MDWRPLAFEVRIRRSEQLPDRGRGECRLPASSLMTDKRCPSPETSKAIREDSIEMTRVGGLARHPGPGSTRTAIKYVVQGQAEQLTSISPPLDGIFHM